MNMNRQLANIIQLTFKHSFFLNCQTIAFVLDRIKLHLHYIKNGINENEISLFTTRQYASANERNLATPKCT